ncbi:MAG: helix-turn-helix transcriptional regulator [Devosia sp.]|nr:helix-turn-helix transcriptional regulator [Devosia sp.]
MSKVPTRRMPLAAGRTVMDKLSIAEFARKLQELRGSKGWNQSDLARAVWGETTDTRGRTVARNRDRISQYERGESVPEPENLARLAEALGVEVSELAPAITAATIDREDPEISMVAVAGHRDKVHLQLNILLPLSIALEIVALVHKAESAAL